MCFGIVFFLISCHKIFSLPFITLVEFWFRLILGIFWNRNLSLYQNTFYVAMNLDMPTNCLSNKLL